MSSIVDRNGLVNFCHQTDAKTGESASISATPLPLTSVKMARVLSPGCFGGLQYLLHRRFVLEFRGNSRSVAPLKEVRSYLRSQHKSGFRGYSTSTPTMGPMDRTSTMEIDPPVVFEKLHKFWFSHITADEQLTLPTLNDNKRWFVQDAAFDKECLYVLPTQLLEIK